MEVIEGVLRVDFINLNNIQRYITEENMQIDRAMKTELFLHGVDFNGITQVRSNENAEIRFSKLLEEMNKVIKAKRLYEKINKLGSIVIEVGTGNEMKVMVISEGLITIAEKHITDMYLTFRNNNWLLWKDEICKKVDYQFASTEDKSKFEYLDQFLFNLTNNQINIINEFIEKKYVIAP